MKKPSRPWSSFAFIASYLWGRLSCCLDALSRTTRSNAPSFNQRTAIEDRVRDNEAIGYVVTKWVSGHTVRCIVANLEVMGYNMCREDALRIIKRYIEISSENQKLGKSIRYGE